MRYPHFNDNELNEQLKLIKRKKHNEEKDNMDEYRFVANCLQVGLTIQDLKELDYIDVAKILVCLIPSDQKYKRATKEDWDKLM